MLLPRGRSLVLGERTALMAILNITPDSFADGGRRLDPAVALADAAGFIEAGADIIDVGGESTRPGAEPVPADEEWRRVGPVIEGIRRRSDVPISIDTYKAEVARRAIDAGADLVNDISALTFDPSLAELVAGTGTAVVLMHTRGRPADMYAQASYDDVVGEVVEELRARDAAARGAGIAANRIILDPGFGFAKRAAHSMRVLAGLPRLQALGRPILSGASRKSFLTRAIGAREPAGRDWATAAAVTASVLLGAHLVRVHDVAAMADVVRVADALRAEAAATLT